jgi:hypothetical protein
MIAVGLAARVIVAIASPHLIWPDEHFQVLEPANRVVNGFGSLTWEWSRGVRNWIMPGLHLPLLYLLRAVGIVGGPLPVIASRVAAAVASAAALFQFGRLLQRRGASPAAVVVALTPLLVLPRMLAWGPATFSDTWATSLLWLGLAPAARAFEGVLNPRRAAFGVGLWLSALFGVRFAMGFWVAPFVGVAAIAYRQRREIPLFMAAGLAAGLLLLGLLDWVTLGQFLGSPLGYYRANIVEGFAASMGVSPWTAYVESAATDLGAVTIALTLGLFAVAVVTRSLRLARTDALVLVPTTVFFGMHCLIGHKEGRFILPVYPALFYAGAMGASGLLRRWPTAAAVLARAGRATAPITATLIALAGWAWFKLPYDGLYSAWGATDLTFAAYEHGALRDEANFFTPCIIETGDQPPDLYSRGQTGFGARIDFRELKEEELRPERPELRRCVYALLTPARRAAFETATAGLGWRWLMGGASGVLLYFRDAPVEDCLAWRQAGSCSATGPREPARDQSCSVRIPAAWSGYCECRIASFAGDCGHPARTCAEVCKAHSWTASR